MDYLKDMSEKTEKQQQVLFDRLIIDIIKQMVELWKEHVIYECSAEGEEEFYEHFVLEGDWYSDINEDGDYEEIFQSAIGRYNFPNEKHYIDNVATIKKCADKYVTYTQDWDLTDISLEEHLLFIAYDRREMIIDLTGGKINTELFSLLHTIPKY